MDCLQIMDSGSFTDLLSAAMSESGLIDLETSNDQPVVDVANSQPVFGTPMSQELMSVSVQPPQLRTNSIIVQRPQLQSPAGSLRPSVIHSSADTQKPLHKIVIRPMSAGLQKSVPSRQLQPVVLQPRSNHQLLIPSNVTSAGQTSVAIVRPVLPSWTTTPLTGSNNVIRPLTASSVSAVNIPSTAVRPTLNAGTLRFTTIPRQLAARLPSGETSMSLQIRPRLPASTVRPIPRTAAPVTGSIMQPVGKTISGHPTLIQATVPLTASSLVSRLSSSSSTTVPSLPGTIAASVAQPAAGCVSSVASCVVSVSCASSVPIIPVTSLQKTTSCDSVDSTSLLFVTRASSDNDLLLKNSNETLQADRHTDSCSVVVLSSAAEKTNRVCTTAAVTVSASTSSINICSPVISSGSLDVSTSSDQLIAVSSTLISSENLSVTAADSEAEHISAENKSICTTEEEAVEQQVRCLKMPIVIEYNDNTQVTACTK